MKIGIIGFDGKNKRNADYALASLFVFFEHYTSGKNTAYFPISVNDCVETEAGRHFFDQRYELCEDLKKYRSWDAMFVYVNEQQPTVLPLFRKDGMLNLNEERDTLYSYAVELVKELLQNENPVIAYNAIILATKYNLCGKVSCPEDYCQTTTKGYGGVSPDYVKALAKAYCAAIA